MVLLHLQPVLVLSLSFITINVIQSDSVHILPCVARGSNFAPNMANDVYWLATDLARDSQTKHSLLSPSICLRAHRMIS